MDRREHGDIRRNGITMRSAIASRGMSCDELNRKRNRKRRNRMKAK